jgi:hypothetical protein
MNRWESNPRESPLYQEHPNTTCDEHGVLRCKPYWNTATKRIFVLHDCPTCGKRTSCERKADGTFCEICNTKVEER